jgi:small ubiquitin-related modifier
MSDVKPVIKDTKPQISIKIRSGPGEEIVFKVKPTTKVGKLMNAYKTRTGAEAGDIRFTFEGQTIHEGDAEKSVAELGLGNDDVIQVVARQIGGC